MIQKIIDWWLDVDPPLQYMVWIISFAMMLFFAVILLIVFLEFGIFWQLFTNPLFLNGAICGFVGFFIYTVLFFVIIWNGQPKKDE